MENENFQDIKLPPEFGEDKNIDLTPLDCGIAFGQGYKKGCADERAKTLREVGKWLEKHMDEDSQEDAVLVLKFEIDAFKQGRFPESK